MFAEKRSRFTWNRTEIVPKTRKEILNSWLVLIPKILHSSDCNLSEIMRKALEHLHTGLQSTNRMPNTKLKFQNYCKHSMNLSLEQGEELWTILNMNGFNEHEMMAAPVLETVKKTLQEARPHQEPQSGVQSAAYEAHTVKKGLHESTPHQASHSGMRSAAGEAHTSTTQQNNIEDEDEPAKKRLKLSKDENDKFQWSTLMAKLLAKHASGITLDKLKKKLHKKYIAEYDVESLTERQQKHFDRKFAKTLQECRAVLVDYEEAKNS